MSDFEEQVKALRQRMEVRHMETLTKMEALRGEHKADYMELSGTMNALQNAMNSLQGSLEKQGLRSEARLEGLEAVLKEEMSGMNSELSMLYGLLSNALSESQRHEGRREDEVQSCVNKIRSLEHRVEDLEGKVP